MNYRLGLASSFLYFFDFILRKYVLVPVTYMSRGNSKRWLGPCSTMYSFLSYHVNNYVHSLRKKLRRPTQTLKIVSRINAT